MGEVHDCSWVAVSRDETVDGWDETGGVLALERLGMSSAGTSLAEPAEGCSLELEADRNVLAEIGGQLKIAGMTIFGDFFVAGFFVAGLGGLGLAAWGWRHAAAFVFRPTSASAQIQISSDQFSSGTIRRWQDRASRTYSQPSALTMSIKYGSI